MVMVKRKSAEYYIENKEVLKKNANTKYRNLSEEKKKQKENMEETDIEKRQKKLKTRDY